MSFTVIGSGAVAVGFALLAAAGAGALLVAGDARRHAVLTRSALPWAGGIAIGAAATAVLLYVGAGRSDGGTPRPAAQAAWVVHAGDGSGSALQRAVDAAADAGGGEVRVNGEIVVIEDTVVLRTGVAVRIAPGTTVRWSGRRGGTLFTSSTQEPLQRASVVGDGAIIDAGGRAAFVFDLHSPQFSRFSGLEIANGTRETTVFRIRADADGASGYERTRNAVFNEIENILVTGPAAVVLDLSGGGPRNVVTLNRFADISAADVHRVGIRLVSWVDSNVFAGIVRLSLRANGATGVIANDSPDPTEDVGVYNLLFHSLAVDTFGDEFVGRRGLVLNKSKAIRVLAFHQDPAAEGGTFAAPYADSYHVTQTGVEGSAAITVYARGMRVG